MITNPSIQAVNHLIKAQLQKGFALQALHVYQTAKGEPLYWRIRLKHSKTQKKWIRPMYFSESKEEFVLGEPLFMDQKPLYHLPLILQSKDVMIWIVEGEYCADQLVALGLIATTSGGVGSVATTDWSPLANRKICIWPDHDAAGKRYADAVTKQLLFLGCEVAWIVVDKLGLPHKGDCVDWLALHPGANLAEIEALPRMSPLSTCDKLPSKLDSFTQPNFIVHPEGIFYQSREDLTFWICSRLEVEALVRDAASENWGRLLVFYDADGQCHRWAMPMEMLKGSGEELRGELLRLGLEIGGGHKVRALLTEYIMTSKPTARACCVNRIGWHDSVFVLPDRTIGSHTETILYQAESITKDYRQSGTLTEWQEAIAKPCRGNSRLVLVISAAFAAMLLAPSGAESGGLHLIGESSTGKTTALHVAASVYGAPNYVYRWRATANGLEALASLRSDTLLILDELAQMDPREAGEAAYLLANGSGKARAGRTGAAKARREWRVIFLSAGEIGLTQHLEAVGKKTQAGQAVRLVEVPIDAGKNLGLFEQLPADKGAAEFSQYLLEATRHYYGTAAMVFLETLTQKAHWLTLQQRIKSYQQSFIATLLPQEANGQAHRVAERFGLIGAAGELAIEYGITGWEKGEATSASMTCFKAWLERRGHAGNQEQASLLAQVQAFFEAHGASRFEDLDILHEHKVVNRVGFKRTQTDGTKQYFVLPEMFRLELCQGFEPRRAAKTLVEVGMLKASLEGKPLTSQRLGQEGVKKCYHFIRTEPQLKIFY